MQSDADARSMISRDLDRSLMVEAAAGTGKTTQLVGRLVAVLASGRTTVDRVVAVTFTRKAAGELKLRLRQELDRARSESSDRRERDALESAIAHLEEARIGTIHSFCGEILRERPVEARIDPAFEELAEDEAPRLYNRAFQGWIQEKLDEMPSGLRRALSRLALARTFDAASPLDRLRDAGWYLVDWRDFPAAWTRPEFERQEAIDRLVEPVVTLGEIASRCPNRRDYLRRALEPVMTLGTWVERAEAVQERDYDALEARLIELVAALKRNKWVGRGKFADGVSRDDVIAARDRLVEKLEDFREQADADLAPLLRGELGEVIERYEDLKRRSGRLDFVDLLIRARDLVRDQPDVRRYLQQRFSHIFVDEFQDTDPLQAEILLLLSADDPEETDWREVRPVAGKLFLVGDPKQSIYRFRRADVMLYQDIKERLSERGVTVLHLTRSFRSTRVIQRFVNAAFEPEMDGNAETGQPSYIPLEEVRKEYPWQPSLVVVPAPRPYGWRRISQVQIEQCLPESLGAFIAWMIQESGWTVEDPEHPRERVPIAPRHVCILFRRFLSWGRDMTREYVRALESRSIPHLLVGARSFHQREEVETLRAALTAVEWPDDELNVFATLRGSLFALPDDLLLRYRSSVGRLHPFALPDDEDGHEDFEPVVEALRSRRDPAAAQVRAVPGEEGAPDAGRAARSRAAGQAVASIAGGTHELSAALHAHRSRGGLRPVGHRAHLPARRAHEAGRQDPGARRSRLSRPGKAACIGGRGESGR